MRYDRDDFITVFIRVVQTEETTSLANKIELNRVHPGYCTGYSLRGPRSYYDARPTTF